MATQTVGSLAGQSMVGQHITTPWLDGAWEVDAGWGPVEFAQAPAGHGYPHWHAGADIGCDCGTVIHLPPGMSGNDPRGTSAPRAQWVDNPGGYGTALVIKFRTIDIWLGHLRQRLVSDGQILRDGDRLAISNNTGNSTGCHLHFEVRPSGGRYGTDIDPSSWILSPAGANSATPLDPYSKNLSGDPFGLQAAVSKGLQQTLAMGQVGLGSTMMLGGLVAVSFGLRGKGMAELQESARSTWRRGSRTIRRRQAAEAGEVAADAAVDRKLTRNMSPEELARWRAGDREFIPEAVKRQQRGRTIEDPSDPRVAGRRHRAALREKFAREPAGPDVEGGLERMRAARVSRVRRSHQKAAVLRDSRGVVIPF